MPPLLLRAFFYYADIFDCRFFHDAAFAICRHFHAALI